MKDGVKWIEIRNEMTEGVLSDGKNFKVGCLIAFINHHLQIGKASTWFTPLFCSNDAQEFTERWLWPRPGPCTAPGHTRSGSSTACGPVPAAEPESIPKCCQAAPRAAFSSPSRVSVSSAYPRMSDSSFCCGTGRIVLSWLSNSSNWYFHNKLFATERIHIK